MSASRHVEASHVHTTVNEDRRKCEAPGDNHSADRVEIHSGRVTPTVLCGYHEMQTRGQR